MLPEQLIAFERRKAEQELRRFFRRWRGEAKSAGRLVSEVFGELERTTLAGTHKRIRPILAILSYRMFGGRDVALARRAAVSLELLHRFLLIHDDIIDRDTIRHGQPSVHEFFRRKFIRTFSESEAVHLGRTFALLAGDLAFDLSLKILSELPVTSGRRAELSRILVEVARSALYGEILELELTWRERVSIKDINQVNTLKTARYSIEAPLAFGATLAGFSQLLGRIRAISQPLGEAFQLQNDLRDLFGPKGKTGKALGSDLEEGKRTFLILETFRRCQSRDRRFLQRLLVSRSATRADVRRTQSIVRSSGSDEAVWHRARTLIRSGLRAIDRLPVRSNESKSALLALAKKLGER